MSVDGREPIDEILHERKGLAGGVDNLMSSLLGPVIVVGLVVVLGFMVRAMLDQEPNDKYVMVPQEDQLLGGLEVVETPPEPEPEVVVEPDPAPEPEPEPAPEPQPGVRTVRVLGTPTDFLNVRNQPSVNSEVLGKVFPGETYEYVMGNSEWALINLGDYRGWASLQYLEISD